jgi:hypothetical protein
MRKTNTSVVVVGRTTKSKLTIGEQGWKNIEEYCDLKIRPRLRSELQQALNIYARCGPGSIKWAHRSVLHKKMRVWAENTDALRRRLSEKTRIQHNPKHGLSLPETPTELNQILQRHFALDQYAKRKVCTDDLTFMLEGSIRLLWSLWLKISQQRNPDSIEYWLIWVSLLISIAKKDGTVKVTWINGRRKGIYKNFVHLVNELQKLLPPEYAVRKEFNSIHKGILLARPIAAGSPIFELKSILEAWHLGDTEFLDVPRKGKFFSPGRVIRRIKRQLASLRKDQKSASREEDSSRF